MASPLVDEPGMAPCFRLLSADLFVDAVPGNAPTEEDFEKFKKPDLGSKKKEHELYQELATVVQSVLDAAGCDALRFVDTANHKARDSNAEKKDTLNDGGIYMNSPLTHEATEDWIDIPFRVKISKCHASAFYFESNPHGCKDPAKPSAPFADPTSTTDRLSSAANTSSESQRGSEGDVASAVDDGEGVEGSVVYDAPSISEALAAGSLAVGEHGAKATTKPGMTTPQVPPFIQLSEHGEKVLEQYVEDILNIQKYQHRTFSYAVYVCYDMARLFYFDRSGVFVSEPFLWDETDSLLHQFVWKIANLANAGRFDDLGHDPTATLASGEAKDMFLALKDDMSLPPHVRDGFKKATADRWPIYKLEVAPGEPSEDEWFYDIPFPPPKEFSSSPTGKPQPSPSQSKPLSKPSSSSDPLPASSSIATPSVRHFLVGRPHFTAEELVGRCTRGYFAYDITDADKSNWRVCFLKDSWRPVVPGLTRPDHLVYQRLRFRGVNKGIGTLICGGDVGGHRAQRTQVQDYLPGNNRPVLRVHYRLVIEEIGIPLEEFNSFPELSAIFVDAIAAHHRAWSLAKVLHGDISVGNIMILPASTNSPRRKGFLIDWDLSRLESELRTDPVKPDRMGTPWQFRSALSLLLPWKPYRRTDDIESFIHVYLYLVLRYHAIGVSSLQELVATLFEGVSLVHGVKIGGDRKLALFTAPRLPFNVVSNPKLQNLLDNIIFECCHSYNTIDLFEMRRRYGVRLPAPQPHPEHPAPRTAIVHFDSDDDIPRSKKRVSLFAKAPPPPRADPERDLSVVKGILSDVGDLVDLFRAHALHPRLDKACDQFLARQHQVVYRDSGFSDAGTSGRIGSDSESTTGTYRSQQVPSNASDSFSSLSSTSRPGSNFGSGPLTRGEPLDSNPKKRARAQDHSKDGIANEDQEPSDSAHSNKCLK